jgi:hypothetical protein
LEIGIPDSTEVVLAQWLTADRVPWPETMERETRRRVLADWMTSETNPYFARNAVNRVWAYLMGQGLIEPVDNLSDLNPPTLPKVLDLLTVRFIESDFSLTELIATITRLEAYQLASGSKSANKEALPLFPRDAGSRIEWRAGLLELGDRSRDC